MVGVSRFWSRASLLVASIAGGWRHHRSARNLSVFSAIAGDRSDPSRLTLRVVEEEAEMKAIEIDDDEELISLIEAAEARARRSSTTVEYSKRQKVSGAPADDGGVAGEGSYMAALRGSRSSLWQQQQMEMKIHQRQQTSFRSSSRATPAIVDAGGRVVEAVVDKKCPCGVGTCLVFTSNTAKNPGRKFYRCPEKDENGGCGFFQWCDDTSSINPTKRGPTYQVHVPTPELQCPCGVGSCLVAMDSGKSTGRLFYRCPAPEPQCCGFFKWCDEQPSTPVQSGSLLGLNRAGGSYGEHFSGTRVGGDGGSGGGSCFKCGQEGHWARDCPNLILKTDANISGGGSGGVTPVSLSSSWSCFKCGGANHWARECPNQSSSSYPVSGGSHNLFSSQGSQGERGASGSNSSCFKCGKAGHWARDCPIRQSWNAGDTGGSHRDPSSVSGSCFKCGGTGHWARDCTRQVTNMSGSAP